VHENGLTSLSVNPQMPCKLRLFETMAAEMTGMMPARKAGVTPVRQYLLMITPYSFMLASEHPS